MNEKNPGRMTRVAVLASGRGSNFEAILAAKDLGATVVALVTDREEAGARVIARAHGVPEILVRPRDYPSRSDHEAALLRALAGHETDLVVLAGYMRLVGPAFLAAYPGRIMNIHPSLLPAFPGLEAPSQSLEYGVKVSGCTVHFIDDGLDTGPIILQRTVPVLPDDSPESLAARIHIEEHQCYPEAIRLFAAGRLRVQGRKVEILEGGVANA